MSTRAEMRRDAHGLETLLSRLDAVKPTGAGRWLARCSAHEDRSPSLAIRETEDGTVLVHCFAGCETEAVLSAVGLTFSDLYPPRLGDHRKPERHPFPASDILKALAHEALVVAFAAFDIHAGVKYSDEDRNRLLLAAQRIRAAVKVSGHA